MFSNCLVDTRPFSTKGARHNGDHYMNITLKHALLVAGLSVGFASAPAKAHIHPLVLGTFDGPVGAMVTEVKNIPGNYGWIDGTDADWGDSHKVAAYQFTLTQPAGVQLSFEQAVAGGGRNGLTPGFSLYEGVASSSGGDHDSTVGSHLIRDRDSGGATTEGSFRALNDWSITDDADPTAVSPSVFTYIGHAYDGSADYGAGVIAGGDGVLDHKVSHAFHLDAGTYTAFVGGSDYGSQLTVERNLGVAGTIAVVPEPETYAMLLAGLGLMGAMARRRRTA
ncbi:MAG: FxDxF family PEP-CTERM protein [Nitrosospira sp.]|nr:FxDxF family PEP-CTERM protein [Nitrosospira sp.]